MIDPEKVEQQLANMVAALAPHVEGDALTNVVARIQTAVIPAFIRWKAGEMNRQSDTNSVLNAVVAFMSSQMVGVIGDVAASEEEAFQIANNMLQGIGEEVGAVLAGARKIGEFHVPAEQAH